MRKLVRTKKVPPRRRRRWWTAAGLAAAVLIGIAVLGTRSNALSGRPRSIPMLAVAPDVKDFGDVSRGGGKLEATFLLRSTGKAPLTISRIVPT